MDLERLISVDWSRRCRSRTFCFQCAAPFCAHCCPGDHRQRHHGGARTRPAQIHNICRAPAVRSVDAVGYGYKTEGIQRFTKYKTNWIPILPQAQVDLRLPSHCIVCHQRVKSGKIFCCMRCRRGHAPHGDGLHMVDRLVEFAGHYGQPTIQLNRFCRVCFRAYNSDCCPDHLSHHHGPHAAAAAANAGAAGAVMFR